MYPSDIIHRLKFNSLYRQEFIEALFKEFEYNKQFEKIIIDIVNGYLKRIDLIRYDND